MSLKKDERTKAVLKPPKFRYTDFDTISRILWYKLLN